MADIFLSIPVVLILLHSGTSQEASITLPRFLTRSVHSSAVTPHSQPSYGSWAGNIESRNVTKLLEWLIGQPTDDPEEGYEYESFNGFYNNLAHPELGAAETPLLRTMPSAYSDGTYQPSFKGVGKNPMDISSRTMNGPNGMTSTNGKTAFLVFFGQQVVEEILDAQRPGCSPEYFNIPIPKTPNIQEHFHNETAGLPSVIPLLRSRSDKRTGRCPGNPRQQLNEITPWIDGGLVYGTAKAWSDVLRTFPNNGSLAPHGRLATDEYGFPVKNELRLPMANPPPPVYHKLQDVSRFYVLGNRRGSENPYLLSFGIMWVRWHNLIADYLHHTRPNWNDEKVFNEARKWVIGTYQHLVLDEWLPSWLGENLPGYEGYKPYVDPQIAEVFQSAAMRFGHTLVVSGVHRRAYARDGCHSVRKDPNDNSSAFNVIRTCNSYFRPHEFFSPPTKRPDDPPEALPYDQLLMGLASQATEKEDNIIVEDLRGFVFGNLEFSRRDLMAVNIQRGRDHGLPSYTQARKALNLTKIPSFDDFKALTSSAVSDEAIKRAKAVHDGDIDIMDIWTGGILETRSFGPGQLFTRIISNQFQRIRDGDRFWFENKLNGLFSDTQIRRMKNLKIKAIVLAVSDGMLDEDIQDNPFRLPQQKGTCDSVNVMSETCARMFNGTLSHIIKTGWRDYDCTCVDGSVGSCQTLQPLGNKGGHLDQCTPPRTYDYFTGSDVDYIVTFAFLCLWLAGCIATLFFLSRRRFQEDEEKNVKEVEHIYGHVDDVDEEGQTEAPIPGEEWLGNKLGYRVVALIFFKPGCHPNGLPRLAIQTERGKNLRSITLKRGAKVTVIDSTDQKSKLINVKTEHLHDLVVKFPSSLYGGHFVIKFGAFARDSGAEFKRETVPTGRQIYSNAQTKEMRQKQLDIFMRLAFNHVIAQEVGVTRANLPSFHSDTLKSVVATELTIEEFADALSMREDAIFVQRMFALVDKDRNGFISYMEFLNFLVMSQAGNGEQKTRMLFDMYDLERNGKMSKAEFVDMIRSFVELGKDSLDQAAAQSTAEDMFTRAGLINSDHLTFDDFSKFMSQYGRLWQNAQVDITAPLGGKVKGHSAADKRLPRGTLIGDLPDSADNEDAHVDPLGGANDTVVQDSRSRFRKYIANTRKEIFWLVLYTGVTIAIVVERAYVYGVESETGGSRKMAWYGVALTKAAASGIMFTFASLLITMCRNLLTSLRGTFLAEYIPFDTMVSMHKYIACWALFFTLLHSIGHAVNFYHISVQPAFDASCLFRDFYRATHVLPSFGYWAWGTITGFTGILLLVLVLTLYVFATQYARRHVFRFFWITHNTYPAIYFLMLLHGMGTLAQTPLAGFFFVGPLIIFTIDRLISVARRSVEIPVLEVEHLPSNVTKLVIKRPPTFEYRSGQWVRIASLGLNGREYHPFTISSAPHEDVLTLHIRAVGPWTTNLRKRYDPNMHAARGQYPRIYLDGPFGEGHQDWIKYDVAVMVGGGIGVTPFASILKDVAHCQASLPGHHRASSPLKKMYFFWVTRNQKQFEWMIDILRDAEEKDNKGFLSTHIFITQLQDKFNFRTTMLYLFERHFQKVSGKSLFTQLRAKTHFGRPNFHSLLGQVGKLHPEVSRIGVFSCCPPQLTSSVDKACQKLTETSDTWFEHHCGSF